MDLLLYYNEDHLHYQTHHLFFLKFLYYQYFFIILIVKDFIKTNTSQYCLNQVIFHDLIL